MKQIVYYSDYMKEQLHDQKVGKLKRICMYTLVAVLSMQGTQMYSMASFMELFQKYTNIKVNAFIPKKYTNVEIEEPNGDEYVIDEDGDVYVEGTDKAKSAYFTNPIDNVTYEYVRARIVAVIKYTEGNSADGGTVVQYTVKDQGNDWIEKDGYYYYKKPLEPGGKTTNLFSSVHIDSPEMNTMSVNGQYIEFNVIVDTIETDENGDTTKADKAWGVTLKNIIR